MLRVIKGQPTVLLVAMVITACSSRASQPPTFVPIPRAPVPVTVKPQTLFLVAAGARQEITRAYLYELCSWLQSSELRDRYSTIVISLSQEDPINRVTRDILGLQPTADLPGTNEVDKERNRKLTELLDWLTQRQTDVNALKRMELQVCHDKPDTPPPNEVTMVIVEHAELGQHGEGVSYVTLATGSAPRRGFANMRTHRVEDAIRRLAAHALASPQEAIDVAVTNLVERSDACDATSADVLCVYQPSWFRVRAEARQTPFLTPDEVIIPPAGQWRLYRLEDEDARLAQEEVVVEGVATRGGATTARIHFRRPGHYRLEFVARSSVLRHHEVPVSNEFEVRSQPVIIDTRTMQIITEQVYGFSNRGGFLPLLSSIQQPDPERFIQGLRSRFATARLISGRQFSEFVADLKGELLVIPPLRQDAGFAAMWRAVLDRTVSHDEVRKLLSMGQVVNPLFVEGRPNVESISRTDYWCLSIGRALLTGVPEEHRFVNLSGAVGIWVDSCRVKIQEWFLAYLLRSTAVIESISIRYAQDEPERSFRLFAQLHWIDELRITLGKSAGAEPALIFSPIPLDSRRIPGQTEMLKLSAVDPDGERSQPIKLKLSIESGYIGFERLELSLNHGREVDAFVGVSLGMPLFGEVITPRVTFMMSIVDPKHRFFEIGSHVTPWCYAVRYSEPVQLFCRRVGLFPYVGWDLEGKGLAWGGEVQWYRRAELLPGFLSGPVVSLGYIRYSWGEEGGPSGSVRAAIGFLIP